MSNPGTFPDGSPDTSVLSEEEYRRFREWASMNKCGAAKFDADVMTLLLNTIDRRTAENDARKGIIDGLEELLACYRLGRRATEKTLDELRDARWALERAAVPRVILPRDGADASARERGSE